MFLPGAAASTQGTQPVVTGAVRVPAASVVDPKQSLLFTGIKKRGVEEEATPSVSTVKTSRSGEELLTCHTACSYRVASLRKQAFDLEDKRARDETTLAA